VEKYIRTTNAILQLGCGNSALADSLYDNGYRNVTSTDAAPTAIRQQIQRNSNARPTLVFEVADATKVRAAVADAACSIVQLPYADAAYNVVIEKGLLDALASASDDVCARMFAQVDRVLAVNGRYIVVSLAQQHVLTIWMKYFSSKLATHCVMIVLWPICRPYILRIIEIARSLDGTDNKAVFVMIATKLVQPMKTVPILVDYTFICTGY
jgi:SAM-dependent methyltransferase